MYKIIKRTFEALKFPEDSLERRKLNENAITSEYLPEDKYLAASAVSTLVFKTKAEAEEYTKGMRFN